MKKRSQLRHGLLFLVLAAGCGGRSTLLPHDQSASGGRLRLGGGTAASGGVGGAVTGGWTTSEGGSEPGIPADAGAGDQPREKDAGRVGEDGARFTPCPADTFNHDGLPATACKPWRNCPPGQYVAAEGTPSADRTCASCPAASFSTAENAPRCEPWLACDGWDQTQKTAGTPTSDRTCTISDGIRITGTEKDDQGTGIAVDNQGNVVIVGTSDGSLAGVGLGAYDAFVRKFNPRGDVVWTRQFGTKQEDMASAVAVAGDGSVFVVGTTAGALEGNSNGEVDAFVRKYDRDGVVAWTRQFGTADLDRATAVAVDAQGRATVAGVTNPPSSLIERPFLRTYAPNGDLVRVYELDLPSSTGASAVAVNADGNVFLAGTTNAEIEGPGAGGWDAFLMKIEPDSHVVWTRQYGTEYTDEALALTLDSGGNPWIAGYQGAHDVGGSSRAGDGFVRRYDARGTLIFSYSIEDIGWGDVRDIAVDRHQHGFVVGVRPDPDTTLSNTSNAYVEELDGEGTLLGPLPLGDRNRADARGVATSDSGRVYVLVNPCNSTFRGHRVLGQCDAFVVQVK